MADVLNAGGSGSAIHFHVHLVCPLRQAEDSCLYQTTGKRYTKGVPSLSDERGTALVHDVNDFLSFSPFILFDFPLPYSGATFAPFVCGSLVDRQSDALETGTAATVTVCGYSTFSASDLSHFHSIRVSDLRAMYVVR